MLVLLVARMVSPPPTKREYVLVFSCLSPKKETKGVESELFPCFPLFFLGKALPCCLMLGVYTRGSGLFGASEVWDLRHVSHLRLVQVVGFPSTASHLEESPPNKT